MKDQKKFYVFKLPLILLIAAVLVFAVLTVKADADTKAYEKELAADRAKIEELENSLVGNRALEQSLTAEAEKLQSESAQQKDMHALWKGKKEWIETLK